MQDQLDRVFDKLENTESGISIRAFFSACLRNWYWFVISVVACTTVAFIFTQSQTQQFRSSAYILIGTDDKNGGMSGEMRIFSDIGLGNRVDAVENEIYVITSTELLDKVVETLGINVEYYSKPLLRKVNMYKYNTIIVTPLSEIDKKGYSLEIVPLNNEEYEYCCPSAKEDKDWHTAKFGAKVDTEKGSFSVGKTKLFSDELIGEKIYVNVSNLHQRAIDLRNNLNVQLTGEETSVLELMLDADNYDMAVDVLSTLIDCYNQDVINDKNRVARNTEAFIVDRIAAISSDLGGIDAQIEQLKIENNIPDLTTAASAYVADGSKYTENVASVEMQLMLARYIKDYLSQMKEHELIPANTGIADMGIEKQIGLYNEDCLKYMRVSASSGIDNPITKELDKSLTSMKDNISRSIENFYNTLQIKHQQALEQERIANRRIASVPTQEKEIGNVLRQQKIKEELYLYLLNKREENALQMAITEPNAKIIEHPGGDDLPIAPATMNITLAGFMFGLILPAGIIYLIFWIYSLDTNIHGRKDVEAATNIPILGELPRKSPSQESEEIVVSETGRDRVTEAFRIVRH